jgi:adenylosuccinate lyase
VIRGHSLPAAEAASRGEPNDLLERLSAEPGFAGIPAEALRAELTPARYTGRAAAQVEEFLAEYLTPLLERTRPLVVAAGPVELTV